MTALRSSLPSELPLAGLRISAIGDRIAVQSIGHTWDAESGQGILAFDVLGGGASGIRLIEPPPQPAPSPHGDIERWFAEALVLEDSNSAAALGLYRKIIAADPQHWSHTSTAGGCCTWRATGPGRGVSTSRASRPAAPARRSTSTSACCSRTRAAAMRRSRRITMRSSASPTTATAITTSHGCMKLAVTYRTPFGTSIITAAAAVSSRLARAAVDRDLAPAARIARAAEHAVRAELHDESRLRVDAR